MCGDYEELPPFTSKIARSPAFQFGMSDIDCIRKEITTLIDNFLGLFLPLLDEQNKAAREAKCVAKQKDPTGGIKMQASLETEKANKANVLNEIGQQRGGMTDVDTTKKLKPAATITIAESVKDLGILSCYVCGSNLCLDGGWWEEKKDHYCKYCKTKKRNIVKFNPPSLAGSNDEKVEKDEESVGSSGDDGSEYSPNKK